MVRSTETILDSKRNVPLSIICSSYQNTNLTHFYLRDSAVYVDHGLLLIVLSGISLETSIAVKGY